MKLSFARHPAFVLLATLATLSGCARPAGTGSGAMTPPSSDPRVGLRVGLHDAGEAIWNLRLVSSTAKPDKFVTTRSSRQINSDLAFQDNLVFQGNYGGFIVWDITTPSRPVLRLAESCPGSQNDVSVFGNLLFVSVEAPSGRIDCGGQGVRDTVSMERIRGVRIFDISDVARPRQITTIQTCRGSHTHTLVSDPNDRANIYVYVSGSAGIRSPSELADCVAAPDDPNTAHFRIEVIRVPLANPEQARIVSSPRIFASETGAFDGLARPPTHATPPDLGGTSGAGGARGRSGGAGGRGAAAAGARGTAPARPRALTQCHDITAYPALGLAGGACEGMGLLLDIRDVTAPRRLATYADTNFAYWHSATFSNDGSKVLFTDEWGGGTQPRCRATDRPEWGANALFSIENNRLVFQGYYKLPAAQTSFENCVAHNGSLIPVPGRDIFVQAWYQGGISVLDWTDAKNPKEIAFFDRGPMDTTGAYTGGGYWSAYWYNGHIIGSEEERGLDIFELLPSGFLSQNEIDAAKTVSFRTYNPQHQEKFVWPSSFAVARAYVDQIERGKGLGQARIAAIRSALARAEGADRAGRQSALSQLGQTLRRDLAATSDRARVQALVDVVSQLSR